MRRSFAWALCLVACAVPALDTAGNIRCGASTEPNGACPTGDDCNAGRCCPHGSTTCPTLANACDGHSVATFAAGSPPALCSTPGSVGAGCARLGSCSDALVCATPEPGGYCTMLCADAVSRTRCAGLGGVCYNVTGVLPGVTGDVCVMRCTVPQGETVARCRNDQPGRYVCTRVVTRTLNDQLCLPDCASGALTCRAPSVCDLRTHQCLGGGEM